MPRRPGVTQRSASNEERKVQYSFSGGEISPETLGRSDLDRWQISLEKCRNWIPKEQGAVTNRPGLEYVGYEWQEKQSLDLMSFTATTSGNPTMITSTGHGCLDGDVVLIVKADTGASGLMGREGPIQVVDDNNFYMMNVDLSGVAHSFVGEFQKVKPSQPVIAVPFTFSEADTYTLYFGDRWMMASRNGGMVLDTVTHTVETIDYPADRTRPKVTLTQEQPMNWFSDDIVFFDNFAAIDPAVPNDHGNKRYRIQALPNVAGDDLHAAQVSIAAISNDVECEITTIAPHLQNAGNRIVIDGTTGDTHGSMTCNSAGFNIFNAHPTFTNDCGFSINIDGSGATDIIGLDLTTAGATSFELESPMVRIVVPRIQAAIRLIGTGGYTEATVSWDGPDSLTVYGRGDLTITSGTVGASSSVSALSTPANVSYANFFGKDVSTYLFLNARSNANPALVFSPGIGVVTHETAGIEYKVGEVTSATTFKLEDRFGVAIDSTSFIDASVNAGTVTSLDQYNFLLDGAGGDIAVTSSLSVSVNRFFVLGTPWSASDLKNLDYAQTSNQMSIVATGHASYTLTREGHDQWTLATKIIGPDIKPPTNLVDHTTPLNPSVQLVLVTSVSSINGSESLPNRIWIGSGAAVNITWDSVEDAFEYNVYMTDVGAFVPGYIRSVEAPSVIIDTTLTPTDPFFPDNAIRPPVFQNEFLSVVEPGFTIAGITLNTPSRVITALPHGLAVGDYVVLSDLDGMVGFNNTKWEVESVSLNTLQGNSEFDEVELLYSSSNGFAPFSGTGKLRKLSASGDEALNPSAVAYHQQRLILANTPKRPQAIYMSRTDDYESFDSGFPPQADDSIILEIADISANAIRWLVPLQQLIALTAGGIYAIVGDAAGVLKPDSAQPVPQYGDGVGNVKPVRFGDSIIHTSAQGQEVFELSASSDFNQARSYIPTPLSVLVPHLFEGYLIESISAQKSPIPVIWFCRNDGILLGLTYLKEFDVFAWHRHDTPGDFESTTTVTEGATSGAYFVVKREFDRVPRRSFERLSNNDWLDIQDAFFVDAGLKYDEAYDCTHRLGSYTSLKLYLDSDHAFEIGDHLDVEHKIRLSEGLLPGLLDGKRFQVRSKSNTTTSPGAYVEVENLDGTSFDGASALFDIDTRILKVHRCTLSVTGLDHLAGEEVAILADGSEKPRQTVSSSGTLTFTSLHSRVIAGLPIESDLLTLPPDSPGSPFDSLRSSKMKTQSTALSVVRTLGLEIGTDLSGVLTPVVWRRDEGFDEPTRPASRLEYLSMDHDWAQGQIAIRQSAPLPATILSIALEFEVDD